jgi:hypothetical protein
MAARLGTLVRMTTLGSCALALGCSVEAVDSPTEAASGSTHALVTVARHAAAAAPGEERADAFAGFLRTAVEVDSESALRAAGLTLDLPAPGQCRKNVHAPGAAETPDRRIELLDAGEVTLAAGGSVTTLAPRAFPTITDFISGVVYTTRDRASSPLPAASGYTVATTGSGSLDPISAEGPAPALLSGVTLAGVPLAEVAQLHAGEDLSVTWEPGAAGDRVYLELDGETVSTLCAFRDDAGLGSVPFALLPASGSAAFSLHRLRESSFRDVGLSRGALRFDFELSASVSFE